MNISKIKEIQAMSAYPSVTITLPVHRTHPDNEKDPIRLKNLVSDAVGRLQEEFGKRETADIVEAIHKLADGVDHAHNLDGLVIFASNDYHASFQLPFRVPERVSIEDNFLTRDLVYAMNRSPLYWLVVLNEHGSRLFMGRKDALSEVEEYGFPFSIEGDTANASPSQDISHVRDQMVTDKMREVGEALAEAQKAVDAPVVVAGVDRNIGHFREGARNSDEVMLYVHSGQGNDNEHELAKNIWPQVREALHDVRQKIFAELDHAKGNKVFVGGLNEVWQAAVDGRVDTLVIEENLHIAAEVSADGRKLTVLEEGFAASESTYDDIVDEMIEKVLAAGGRVRFVDDGALRAAGADQGMAAITRY